ncbi:MAG TPA: hypothetical protein VMU84_13430 [Thermoanaerobaculia bacterium]|nr:hypothetical protein [Thermoanaerobaculia bacterium]
MDGLIDRGSAPRLLLGISRCLLEGRLRRWILRFDVKQLGRANVPLENALRGHGRLFNQPARRFFPSGADLEKSLSGHARFGRKHHRTDSIPRQKYIESGVEPRSVVILPPWHQRRRSFQAGSYGVMQTRIRDAKELTFDIATAAGVPSNRLPADPGDALTRTPSVTIGSPSVTTVGRLRRGFRSSRLLVDADPARFAAILVTHNLKRK